MKPYLSQKFLRSIIFKTSASVLGLIFAIGVLTKFSASFLQTKLKTATISIEDTGPVTPGARIAPSNSVSAPRLASSQSSTVSVLHRALLVALSSLRTETDPNKSRLLLEALKAQLMRNDDKAEAVGTILEFLHSGRDATTGLAFRVGPNHVLAESPTLRTALLDWLGQLNPVAAAQNAPLTFESRVSAEEYVMALRNFARGYPERRDELRDYFNRLLSHTPWANPPSAGYLESFDVVPHLADPSFIPPLSALLAPTAQTSVRHAALVAMDRLVLTNPAGALEELLQTKAFDAQPLLRASFIARADIRDAIQRQIVESYLLSPFLSDRELDKFVLLFPNANRFLSFNLLTESGGSSPTELARLDAAALELVRAWRSEPRFSRLQSRLSQLEGRLRQHVESAIRGRYL